MKRIQVAVLIVAVCAACSSSHHASLGHPTSAVAADSPVALQLRRVLATAHGSCRAVDRAKALPAGETITLPGPNSDTLPCLRLGPALVQFASALRVDLSMSPAGLILVNVVLHRSDAAALHRVVARLRSTGKTSGLVAIVGIGQVLSTPDIQELSQPGSLAGHLQVAGGLDPADRRPEELASALHAVVRTVR